MKHIVMSHETGSRQSPRVYLQVSNLHRNLIIRRRRINILHGIW